MKVFSCVVVGAEASVKFGRVQQGSGETRAQGGTHVATSGRDARVGLFFGLSAYTIWGFIPVYFRAVSHVPSTIVLCHRIIWSALFMGLLVTIRGEWKPVLHGVRAPGKVWWLALAALLIASNWLIFIYAVATRQLLQASLGYFINPLLSVALGLVFLRERLRGAQWVAVLIAALAVGNLALRAERFPWIALGLAGSFGFYGLLRKKINVNSVHGLLVESLVLLPLAALGLGLLPSVETSSGTLSLLSLSGVITAVPLLFFGGALRRLKLSTMGFLQYVGPTLQFLVATCLFREPLDRTKLASFALCWLAIAVYVGDSMIRRDPQPIADEPE